MQTQSYIPVGQLVVALATMLLLTTPARWCTAGPQTNSSPTLAVAAPVANSATGPLVWDSLEKSASPKADDETAEFTFSVTNVSETAVVIDYVHTSCGCTVANIPSQPWVLAPHTNGELGVSVNLGGKSGTFQKTIDIFTTSNVLLETLVVQVNMPDSPEVTRGRNQMSAMADRQAVFKGDCAKCHAEPAQGKMAKELYVAACGICHDAKPRATMVTNLRALNHPTDFAYWKQWIVNGKPGTMMPAFATEQGGLLTAEQIESLAKTLVVMIPSIPPLATDATRNTSAPAIMTNAPGASAARPGN